MSPLRSTADLVKQSTAYNRMVLMQDSTAARSPGVAGLTLMVTASKNGGAFASISPTVTDRGSGWYNLALSTTDTNTVGALTLHVTAAGVDASEVKDQVYDPAALVAYVDSSGVTTLLARVPGTVQPQTGDAYAQAALTYSRLGAPAGASHAADIAAVPASVWAIGTRTLTGSVTVGGYSSGQDPATLVLAATVQGTLTLKQTQALAASVIAGKFAVTRNTSAKTLTTTYYSLASPFTSVMATMVTTYADAALTQAVSRSVTWSGLP